MFLVLVSIFSMKTDQDERQMAKEESEVERNELTCKWTASWTFKNMICQDQFSDQLSHHLQGLHRGVTIFVAM